MFAALSFVGFEAAATLGDEVREPRRIVPRAVLVSVLLVGLIYVFCIWAEVNGLGIAATNELTGASTPWNDLAATYASWMKWPVIIASVSSMFAVMINSSNGIVRILNTMGREGLLPRMFAFIDPKRHTPSYAIFATGAFALVLGAGRRRRQRRPRRPRRRLERLRLPRLPADARDPPGLRAHQPRGGALLRHAPGASTLIRHGVLPLGGAALMVALLIGQILEQTVRPYTWFPWLIVIWVVLMAAGAQWLASRRAEQLELAGAVLASAESRAARETGGGP